MPTRREWRTGFVVGLFLFGPGLESYLRRQAASQMDPVWAKFYGGLADIVRRAGADPNQALELADRLYDELWGRPRRRPPPSRRSK
jgi:hypothetical protein